LDEKRNLVTLAKNELPVVALRRLMRRMACFKEDGSRLD
jgi:hypothetical protein